MGVVMKKLDNRMAAVFAIATLMLTASVTTDVFAHHSFAMFDQTKPITISGTIKKTEWTNPHVWIWVEVPKADGGSNIYGLEAGSPSTMQRVGATYSMFQVGKKLTVLLYPMKDGRLAGQPRSFEFADGTKFNLEKSINKFVEGG